MSHSASSALLDINWRKVWWLIKSIIKETIGSDAQKLINIIEKLTTENALLIAENHDLQQAVCFEKNHRRHKKSLFENLNIDDDVKEIFFNFKKIQRTQKHQTQRDQDAQQAAAQKTEERHQKELKKQQKQHLIVKRRIVHEERQMKWKKKAKQKKKLWVKALKQKHINWELKMKTKELNKNQRKKTKEV